MEPIDGVVVASADAEPFVAITVRKGDEDLPPRLRGASPGDYCDRFVYLSIGKMWDFHWKPKNAKPGSYYVVVHSGKTGQRFPAEGPGFKVVFSAW
jgi:hypothetical protein